MDLPSCNTSDTTADAADAADTTTDTTAEAPVKLINRQRLNVKDMTEGMERIEEDNYRGLQQKVIGAKLGAVMRELKQDPRLVGDITKLVSSNPRLDQGARNMARNVGNDGIIGMETPLNQRKKLLQQQQAMVAMSKIKVPSGAFYGVMVNAKGGNKCNRIPMTIEDLEDEKYSLQTAIIQGQPFIVVTTKGLASGRNALASRLIDPKGVKVAFGPVIFMKLDLKDERLLNVELGEFQQLVQANK